MPQPRRKGRRPASFFNARRDRKRDRKREWQQKHPQAQQLTSPEKLPTLNHQCRFFRAAVRLAPLDLGLLTMNPRSITPPFKLKKRAKIS
jgi:hypothetical protein